MVHLTDQSSQAMYLGQAHVLGALRQHHWLQSLTHEIELNQLIEIQLGNTRTYIGLKRHESFACQTSQRFTDRNAARSELAGYLLLADASARLEPPLQDCLAQARRH